MDLMLYQREVAEILDVSEVSVYLWESRGNFPKIIHMPGIIEFLGYVPLLEPKTLPEQLKAYRMIQGLSQRAAAKQFQTDPSSWFYWENGRQQPQAEKSLRIVSDVRSNLSRMSFF